MTNVQIVYVSPNIPEPIRFLETLSRNIWWSWNPDAAALFRRIDASLWRDAGENALEFMRRLPQPTIAALAEDEAFKQQLAKLETKYNAATARSEAMHGKVAYFSLEFGLHETIRLYSGGLGLLAGDHLKAASDLGVPLTGVGLFYHQGFFEQRLNEEGWQQERYPENDISSLPMRRARTPEGEPFYVSIPLPEGLLQARVWQLMVGGVPLILLDANVPENPPEFREITARLYGGGQANRLRQELLLAIGGFRALLKMGIEPEVCHLNEGHAAFLSIARMEFLQKTKSLSLEAAAEIVSRSNVFTTHTPVPAGNETFPISLVEAHLRVLEAETRVPVQRVIEWGRAPGEQMAELSMTILGLRLSTYANGVSKLHGEVSRGMWNHVWPGKCREEVPIGHITNGVHAPTWLSPEINALIELQLGPDWQTALRDPKKLAKIDAISDDDLWRAHEAGRGRLLRAVRTSVDRQLQRRCATRAELNAAKNLLDPNVLTIGFARRAASYKRATLLLRNPERLEALLNHSERPIQIVFAGKAHPHDDYGKDFIRQVVSFAKRSNALRRMVFVENYDIGVAKALMHGVDVWLNTPRRRLEASGTSGMKAAMNGGLNASILDGWWCEGYAPDCGWAIGNGEEFDNEDYQDDVESAALYRLIEDEICPLFYDRSSASEPARWIAMMKASMKMALGTFTTWRMVAEYRDSFYKPASDAYRRLTAENAAAAYAKVAQRQRLDSLWHEVRVTPPKSDRELGALRAGDTVKIRCSVGLGMLKPAEVSVEVSFGPVDSTNEIRLHKSLPMTLVQDHGDGWYDYEESLAWPASGRYGLTARVLPSGTIWRSVSPGHITWA